jgi:hypothetical protein
MIKQILISMMMFQMVLLPVSQAFAQETPEEEPATSESFRLTPLPPLSYSFAKAGTSLTLKTDLFLVESSTWAYLMSERENQRGRFQLELDTRLALQGEQHKLMVDLQVTQIDFLNRELARTNSALEAAQSQGKWAWVPPVVFIAVGALVTTGLVFGLTKGDGIN